MGAQPGRPALETPFPASARRPEGGSARRRPMITPTSGRHTELPRDAKSHVCTCDRIISLAPDKLAALTNLACGFARDIRDGYLSQLAVTDRLHEDRKSVV